MKVDVALQVDVVLPKNKLKTNTRYNSITQREEGG